MTDFPGNIDFYIHLTTVKMVVQLTSDSSSYIKMPFCP